MKNFRVQDRVRGKPEGGIDCIASYSGTENSGDATSVGLAHILRNSNRRVTMASDTFPVVEP